MDRSEQSDAWARILLTDSIRTWFDAGTLHDHLETVEETEAGNLIIVYSGTSADDIGSFRCEFMPLDFARKALIESKRLLLSASFTYRFENEEHSKNCRFDELPEDEQEYLIHGLAGVALSHLLTGLRARLCEMFEEASEEAFIQAEAVLKSSLAKQLTEHFGVSFRLNPEGVKEGIKEEVDKAAKKKRERLAASLNKLPLLHIPTGSGRPPGSKSKKAPETLDRENTEHRGKILKAMCSLYRKEANEFLAEDAIKRTTVADEMNISRTTLAAWLESGGYEFDDLKDEAISMCSRN